MNLLPPFVRCVVLAALGSTQLACGGAASVRVLIDKFGTELALDDAVGNLEGVVGSTGLLAIEADSLPELWPDSLPDVVYTVALRSPPTSVDLTPEDDSDTSFQAFEQYSDNLKRVEINRLIVRIERNTSTVAIPPLRLEVADKADADPNSRRLWQTVGTLPGAEPGFIGDLDFTYQRGGESNLNAQFVDDEKDFSIRTSTRLTLDTAQTPTLPRGALSMRLIMVVTIFVAAF